MIYEIFETLNEFKKAYPSKIYICSRCGTLTTNPCVCINCDNQSNNFLLQEKVLNYKILENGEQKSIFIPIELLRKGENNVK